MQMFEKTYHSVQWSVRPGMNKTIEYKNASANSYLLNSFSEVCMHCGLHQLGGILGKTGHKHCSIYIECIIHSI
jgi:hypothetical protein